MEEENNNIFNEFSNKNDSDSDSDNNIIDFNSDYAQFEEDNEPLLTPDDFTQELSPDFQGEKVPGGTKIIKQKDIKLSPPVYNEEEINKILETPTEEILKHHFQSTFQNEVSASESSDDNKVDELFDYKEYQITNFKDFLELPKISGPQQSISGKRVISKDLINKDPSEKVEVYSEPPFKPIKTGESSVIVNRNLDGEIESIEVCCKDGERILIRFDFDDSNQQTEIID
jgi:hypothetical protein